MAADALILSVALAFQVNVLRGDKEAASLARERERTAFAKRILQAKEQERRSIGKALHDSLGHKILAIKASLGSVNSNRSEDRTETEQLLKEAITEVRDLSHLLYPSIIEHLGLKTAVGNAVGKVLQNAGISYEVTVSACEIDGELETLIYRAAQECVNNVVKHSDASEFTLAITTDQDNEHIQLVATDNGSDSFDENDIGFGLSMLRKQAALFEGSLTVARASGGQNVLTLIASTQR